MKKRLRTGYSRMNADFRKEPARGIKAPTKNKTYQARDGLWYANYLTSPDARADFKAKRLKPNVKYPSHWGDDT